ARGSCAQSACVDVLLEMQAGSRRMEQEAERRSRWRDHRGSADFLWAPTGIRTENRGLALDALRRKLFLEHRKEAVTSVSGWLVVRLSYRTVGSRIDVGETPTNC